jgi:hypothetical protein
MAASLERFAMVCNSSDIEGQNIQFEYRFADAVLERLPN